MEMTSYMRIQVVFGLAPGGAAQRSGLIHVGMLRSLKNKKLSCFLHFHFFVRKESLKTTLPLFG
jgi:hypothetical protein